MTRDEALEHYRSVRDDISRLIELATKAISVDDLSQAIDEIAPWMDDKQIEGEALSLFADVALFEPGESGQRVFDRFRKKQARELTSGECALAERMAKAEFSIFRVCETNEAAGLWLEAVLDHDRRVWVVDEALEKATTPSEIIATRLFDAGPFHACLGAVIKPGDESLGPCLAAWARRGPLPDQGTLAAQIYSDYLAVEGPADEDELEFLASFAEALVERAPDMIEHGVPLPTRQPPKRSNRRKR